MSKKYMTPVKYDTEKHGHDQRQTCRSCGVIATVDGGDCSVCREYGDRRILDTYAGNGGY